MATAGNLKDQQVVQEFVSDCWVVDERIGAYDTSGLDANETIAYVGRINDAVKGSLSHGLERLTGVLGHLRQTLGELGGFLQVQ